MEKKATTPALTAPITKPEPLSRTRGKRPAAPAATTTSEAYLKTVMAALDCNDPAQLAEKAQRLQEQVKTLQLGLAGKGNELSITRGETRTYLGYFSQCFAEMNKTRWECAMPSDLPGRISGLVAGWELAKNTSAYFQGLVLKTCSMLGTDDPKLIEEKLQLVLSHKDELDNLTRNAQLCFLPQWRPAKRENLAEAVTNLCDSWSANVDRIRDMEQKSADPKREYEAVTSELSNLHLAHDQVNANVARMQEECDGLAQEVNRLTADKSNLPSWARALAWAVWTYAVFAVAHKFGFEAHAALGGGK